MSGITAAPEPPSIPIRRSVAFQAYRDRSNNKANRPPTLPQFYGGAWQDEAGRQLCGNMRLHALLGRGADRIGLIATEPGTGPIRIWLIRNRTASPPAPPAMPASAPISAA